MGGRGSCECPGASGVRLSPLYRLLLQTRQDVPVLPGLRGACYVLPGPQTGPAEMPHGSRESGVSDRRHSMHTRALVPACGRRFWWVGCRGQRASQVCAAVTEASGCPGPQTLQHPVPLPAAPQAQGVKDGRSLSQRTNLSPREPPGSGSSLCPGLPPTSLCWRICPQPELWVKPRDGLRVSVPSRPRQKHQEVARAAHSFRR